MLPAGKHVEGVFTRPGTGLLSMGNTEKKRRLFIDCSTIDTATCKRVGAAVEASGLGDFGDAPVSVSG